MVVVDVGGVKIQIVNRRGRPYARLLPSSVYNPSAAQAEARVVFQKIAAMARRLTPEEVAWLVGGEVYRGSLIRMPDGRVLPKAAALVAYYMRDFRPPRLGNRALLNPPKWRRVLDQRRQAIVDAIVSSVARVIRQIGMKQG